MYIACTDMFKIVCNLVNMYTCVYHVQRRTYRFAHSCPQDSRCMYHHILLVYTSIMILINVSRWGFQKFKFFLKCIGSTVHGSDSDIMTYRLRHGSAWQAVASA